MPGLGNGSLHGKARGIRGQDTVEHHGGFDVVVAFERVPIGIGDGLPQDSRVPGGLPIGAGCPELEPPAGAVEMMLVPSDYKYLESPACLATGRLRMVDIICPRNQGRCSD